MRLFLSVSILMYTTFMFGQRPDVVYLRDSKKLIGQISVQEGGDFILLRHDDGTETSLGTEEVERFVDYAENSGKLRLEAIVMATAEGKNHFIITPRKHPDAYHVFTDLNGELWLQHPDTTGLINIPEKTADYQDFIGQIPGYTPPAIGARRALRRTKKSPYLLASYLNKKGFRILPGSFRLSASYGLSKTTEITNDNIYPDAFSQPIIDGQDTPLVFELPDDANSQFWSIRGDYRTFLTTDGRIDISMGAGYTFQRVKGLGEVTAFSERYEGQVRTTGYANHVMANIAMNYYVNLNTVQIYTGVGISLEAPINQEHRLDNFFLFDDTIYPHTAGYQGSYGTLAFPALEVGIERSLSSSFWLSAFFKCGLRSNAIENYNPTFSFGTAINY